MLWIRYAIPNERRQPGYPNDDCRVANHRNLHLLASRRASCRRLDRTGPAKVRKDDDLSPRFGFRNLAAGVVLGSISLQKIWRRRPRPREQEKRSRIAAAVGLHPDEFAAVVETIASHGLASYSAK